MNRTENVMKILDAQGAYCGQCSREPGDSLNACRDCAAVLESYAHALEEAGVLAPDVQIIRTLAELEALDPDAWLMQADKDAIPMVVDDWIHDHNIDGDGIFPLVVMMDGAQVRAAREALEEENE